MARHPLTTTIPFSPSLSRFRSHERIRTHAEKRIDITNEKQISLVFISNDKKRKKERTSKCVDFLSFRAPFTYEIENNLLILFDSIRFVCTLLSTYFVRFQVHAHS